MPDVITFTVGLPPRALRRNSETRNHGYRARLVREYQEQVWCAGQDGIASYMRRRYAGAVNTFREYAVEGPWTMADVTYHWYSTHETDEDNIIANMKPALDVLKATGPRPLGIIADDGPGVTVRAEWHKAAHKRDETILVQIERRQG